MADVPKFYCCIPIEFIQPWDQELAIRQVAEHGLGNMVIPQSTGHVGNDAADRQRWKDAFPALAERIDATPVYPERPEHGMAVIIDLPVDMRIAQLELCRELGLGVFCLMLAGHSLTKDERARLHAAAKGVVVAETHTCENTSMLGHVMPNDRLRELDRKPVASFAETYHLKASSEGTPSIFDDVESLTFASVRDWWVEQFARYARDLRQSWNGPLVSYESSTQMRLSLAAGTDLPVFELVPSEPLRGLASVRGAAKGYGKPTWGVHTAMGYYRAPTDSWTPERLRIAYDLFYIGGASIFSEPNMPIRNWGSCSGFFTIKGSPAIRWAEKECREFDDPICARAREVVREHYAFTQFHSRPADGPRVPMGFVLGHLDGWTGHNDERMWMIDHRGFAAPAALKSWKHFAKVFDSERWYDAPHTTYWQADPAKALRHGTPPCGQVDIVPIESSLDALRTYKLLVLLGWNTMTDEHYEKLKAFVEAGGTLLLSTAHLSTRTRADQPQQFIKDGKVCDLCGLHIKPGSEAAEDVFFTHQASDQRYVFPQGTLYVEAATLAKVELHGGRTLAHPRDREDLPALVEHKLGKGVVYTIPTADYVGEQLDAFVTDLIRTLAEGQQGDIAVRGRDVFYAVYDRALPSGQHAAMVYLVNHDIYGQPAYPHIVTPKGETPVRVAGDAMRIVWLCGGLLVSPHDRFTEVADVQQQGDTWTVTLRTLQRQTDCPTRRVQLACPGGRMRAAAVGGNDAALLTDINGESYVDVPAADQVVITVQVSI